MEYLTIGLLAAIFVAALLLLWLAVSARRRESAQLAAVKALSAGQEESYKQLTQELRFTRQELLQSTQSQVRSMAESLAELQKQSASLQDKLAGGSDQPAQSAPRAVAAGGERQYEAAGQPASEPDPSERAKAGFPPIQPRVFTLDSTFFRSPTPAARLCISPSPL